VAAAQAAVLEAQQAVMDADLKAEQDVPNKLAGLRCACFGPDGCYEGS
jgi:hypothetical protein